MVISSEVSRPGTSVATTVIKCDPVAVASRSIFFEAVTSPLAASMRKIPSSLERLYENWPFSPASLSNAVTTNSTVPGRIFSLISTLPSAGEIKMGLLSLVSTILIVTVTVTENGGEPPSMA